jgi:hypothetical protein
VPLERQTRRQKNLKNLAIKYFTSVLPAWNFLAHLSLLFWLGPVASAIVKYYFRISHAFWSWASAVVSLHLQLSASEMNALTADMFFLPFFLQALRIAFVSYHRTDFPGLCKSDPFWMRVGRVTASALIALALTVLISSDTVEDISGIMSDDHPFFPSWSWVEVVLVLAMLVSSRVYIRKDDAARRASFLLKLKERVSAATKKRLQRISYQGRRAEIIAFVMMLLTSLFLYGGIFLSIYHEYLTIGPIRVFSAVFIFVSILLAISLRTNAMIRLGIFVAAVLLLSLASDMVSNIWTVVEANAL